MASTAPEATEPQVVFRPGKKRKIYRQRPREAEGSPTGAANEKPATTSILSPRSSLELREASYADPEEEGIHVAEVIRRRNARKARLGGVAFRAESTPRSEGGIAGDGGTEQALVVHEGGGSDTVDTPVGGIVKRFASQTGLVGELVNKHM